MSLQLSSFNQTGIDQLSETQFLSPSSVQSTLLGGCAHFALWPCRSTTHLWSYIQVERCRGPQESAEAALLEDRLHFRIWIGALWR